MSIFSRKYVCSGGVTLRENGSPALWAFETLTLHIVHAAHFRPSRRRNKKQREPKASVPREYKKTKPSGGRYNANIKTFPTKLEDQKEQVLRRSPARNVESANGVFTFYLLPSSFTRCVGVRHSRGKQNIVYICAKNKRRGEESNWECGSAWSVSRAGMHEKKNQRKPEMTETLQVCILSSFIAALRISVCPYSPYASGKRESNKGMNIACSPLHYEIMEWEQLVVLL